MAGFFARNIERRGRIARAILGVLLIAGAIVAAWYSWWAAGLLAVSGGFTLFEASRGWCVMRACGIKTKM